MWEYFVIYEAAKCIRRVLQLSRYQMRIAGFDLYSTVLITTSLKIKRLIFSQHRKNISTFQSSGL